MKLEIKKPILMMVPFPAQGHVTPMLNLASSFSQLKDFNFLPLMVVPDFIHRQLTRSSSKTSSFDPSTGLWNDQVMLVSIPASSDVKDEEEEEGWDFFSIVDAMENHMPCHLKKLIGRLTYFHVVGVIVDLLASWAIPVARECGLTSVAGFWPASVASYHTVQAIPHLITSGFITQTGIPFPLHDDNKEQQTSFYPNQPLITPDDLLWSIGTLTQRLNRFKFWITTLNRSTTLPWLLVNSFPHELLLSNSSTTDHQGCVGRQTIYTVGMLIQHLTTTTSPRLSLWTEDRTCLTWLDHHPPNSVIYVSFGSWFSPSNTDKVTRLALALESCNRPFLWALGPNWRAGLPNGYIDRISQKGKVVGWAPQLEVLRHEAVGCFFTHCGWNSTMEAIRCGKSMLCHPIGGDQALNCKYVTSVWRIGVEVVCDGIDEVRNGLDEVMCDVEMKRRVDEMKERVMGDNKVDGLVSVANDFMDLAAYY